MTFSPSVLPSPSPYRDDGFAARMRYSELLAEKRRALKSVEPLAVIHGRRVGRIAGGATGIVGFAVMVADLIVHVASGSPLQGNATAILFGTWALSLAVYAAASRIAEARFGRAGIPPRSEDVWADIGRLQGIHPDRALREDVDRRELWSVALPMMALSLLGPLTLHAIGYGLFVVTGLSDGPIADFDKWIGMSLCIVGHAHLVCAWLCYRYAKKARALPTAEVHEASEVSDRRTFWWTILASAIPGALLYLIPPVLAMLTGRGISWLMFRFMRDRILLERAALEVE